MEALAGLRINSWNQSAILQNLRDFIEDRIESEFDVVAELATSDSGTLDITACEGLPKEITTRVRKFAEECVQEFRTLKPDVT
jgi:hypothetical protein